MPKRTWMLGLIAGAWMAMAMASASPALAAQPELASFSIVIPGGDASERAAAAAIRPHFQSLHRILRQHDHSRVLLEGDVAARRHMDALRDHLRVSFQLSPDRLPAPSFTKASSYFVFDDVRTVQVTVVDAAPPPVAGDVPRPPAVKTPAPSPPAVTAPAPSSPAPSSLARAALAPVPASPSALPTPPPVKPGVVRVEPADAPPPAQAPAKGKEAAASLVPGEDYRIEVSVSQCLLWLYRMGAKGEKQLVREYAVATAKHGMDYPEGEGHVTGIDLNPAWTPTPAMLQRAKAKGQKLRPQPPGSKANPMGAFKIHLSHGDAYRIHGTNKPGQIGKRVSQGCVRMHNDQGLALARVISVGTPVHVRF